MFKVLKCFYLNDLPFTTNADFKTPSLDSKKNHVIEVAIGTLAGILFIGLLTLGIMSKKGCLGSKISADKGMFLQNPCFSKSRSLTFNA